MPAPLASPRVRRARVRRSFSDPVHVRREHVRLRGAPDRDLRGELIERFLALHLRSARGPVLEIGPGPGRFTPTLLRGKRRVVLFDLSRPMLRAARRQLGGGPRAYVEGAAEGLLPFRSRTFGAVILVGLFGFFGKDSRTVLREAHRVLLPGGVVIVEGQNLPQATVVLAPPNPEGFRAIFRDPERSYLNAILRNEVQPYDPPHGARYEFKFWRSEGLASALKDAGFIVTDRMAVAPLLGAQPNVLRAFQKDRRAWSNLLRFEEAVGRWPTLVDGGLVGLVAGHRRGGRA